MNLVATTAAITILLLTAAMFATQTIRNRTKPQPAPEPAAKPCCVYCGTLNELGDPYTITWDQPFTWPA